MKKTVLVTVLVISVLLAASCKSTGGQAGGTVTDETFSRVYNKYANRLILEGAQSYTVKSGDTLAHIARSLYNDGYYYPVIMLASRDVVLDPDKIQPGMTLTIPDLQKNLDNSGAKSAIKGVTLDCADIENDRGRADTAKGLRDHANSL